MRIWTFSARFCNTLYTGLTQVSLHGRIIPGSKKIWRHNSVLFVFALILRFDWWHLRLYITKTIEDLLPLNEPAQHLRSADSGLLQLPGDVLCFCSKLCSDSQAEIRNSTCVTAVKILNDFYVLLISLLFYHCLTVVLSCKVLCNFGKKCAVQIKHINITITFTSVAALKFVLKCSFFCP